MKEKESSPEKRGYSIGNGRRHTGREKRRRYNAVQRRYRGDMKNLRLKEVGCYRTDVTGTDRRNRFEGILLTCVLQMRSRIR